MTSKMRVTCEEYEFGEKGVVRVSEWPEDKTWEAYCHFNVMGANNSLEALRKLLPVLENFAKGLREYLNEREYIE